MNSILDSVKKMLGIEAEYIHFDSDIIMHINSVFSILFQLGVGEKPFKISDNTSTWDDLIGECDEIEDVKSYVFLKTRLLFDPPASSVVTESYNKMIAEIEWRINVAVDKVQNEEKPDDE